jgi:hypothetical protein
LRWPGAWAPYQHGLTLQRYLVTLAFQTSITLFNLWYCDTNVRVRSTNSIIMAALLLAVVVGVIWGYRMAELQYQFFNPSAVHVRSRCQHGREGIP